MKESRFIGQNSKKWSDFQKSLASREKDPNLLSRFFIQITDDLSFARTFYPNRSIRNYLNALAEGIFINIHRGKKLKVSDFTKFWKSTLPLMNYEARGEFLISFVVFTLAVVIGMVSSASDPSFPAFILGEDYVTMARSNIEKGDPMSVYKEFLPFEGFLQITLNNLLVAAYTFVFGVFSAIGTLFIMLFNGVMVGAFQQFYINEGLFRDSFLTIWQHGTMEISSIIIAGASGLTMGKGLLFPGTYSRLQSFSMSARRGLKIFIGIVPPIILAGFIEGYLTRNTGLPDVLRLAFILVSLAVMVLYYVWYPRQVARSEAGKPLKKEKVELPLLPEADLGKIYSIGELFEHAMGFTVRRFSVQLKPFALLAALSAGIVYVSVADEFNFLSINWHNPYHASWMYFFDYSVHRLLFPFILIACTVVITLALRSFIIQGNPALSLQKPPGLLRFVFISLLIAMMTNLLFFLNFWLAFFVLMFLFPVMAMVAFVFVVEDRSIFYAIGRGLHMFFYKSSLAAGLVFRVGFLIILVMFFLFVFLMTLPAFLIMLLDLDYDQYATVLNLLNIFAFYLALYFGVGMMVIAMGRLYFTMHEMLTAENLLHRIAQFGKSKKILGYERE